MAPQLLSLEAGPRRHMPNRSRAAWAYSGGARSGSGKGTAKGGERAHPRGLGSFCCSSGTEDGVRLRQQLPAAAAQASASTQEFEREKAALKEFGVDLTKEQKRAALFVVCLLQVVFRCEVGALRQDHLEGYKYKPTPEQHFCDSW